ncbi:MAG: NHLP bacteriocin system secretion protein [Bacillota bacterium]
MSDKKIFTGSSKREMHSPENLNQLIKIVSRKDIFVSSAFFLLIVVFVSWSILGNIPSRIGGKGVLMAGGGIKDISHNFEGLITDISVREGDLVEAGDVVARIDQSELIDKIKESKVELEQSNIQDQKKLLAETKKLQNEYEYRSQVKTYFSGRVLEIEFNRGNYLYKHETLLSLEEHKSAERELEGFIYVSAFESKKIKKGMDVKISPTFLKKEEYGFILAKVIKVSDFPVSKSRINKNFGSTGVSEMFENMQGIVEIQVELRTNNDNFSGLEWTSGSGPDLKISSGSLCDALIMVDQQRPIELLFPLNLGGE